jgi:ABC-type nitrate/sulfonate/bicarbonate transport system ATPase subunit
MCAPLTRGRALTHDQAEALSLSDRIVVMRPVVVRSAVRVLLDAERVVILPSREASP